MNDATTLLQRPTGRWTDVLWMPLLWAVPFGLFFGTLYGGTWAGYRGAFLISVVFSYVTRFALLAAEALVLPRVRATAPADPHPWLREGAVYLVTSVAASYLAALLVNAFVWEGFLRGPRAWVVTGLFSFVFSLLIGGLAYARAFYLQGIERAAQVERIRAELARAELRALRAQINPHFLFNTLNSIAALIGDDPASAEDVVTRLAEVFRYALASSDREHARFGDELEFLRAYLAIERVRLGERLTVEESIEPGLETVPVPGLLLQPLVENAVHHGVAARPGGGVVRLSARRADGSLLVVIADDGPGFVVGGPPSGNGVGLESVRERLRLAGPGHAIAVDTAPGRGTRVTVTLPFGPHAPREENRP